MKRGIAWAAAILLALSGPASPLQAGWVDGLIKVGRTGRNVGRVAGKTTEVTRVVNKVRALSPELRGMEEGVEAIRYAAALDEVEVGIAIGKIEMTSESFRGLFRSSVAQRMTWSDGIPLADDMPNVIVKAPRITGASEALRIFTMTRLDDALKAPFSVSKLKVVALGMTDDASRSANEIAAFRRTIPGAQFDNVGSLSRLGDAKFSKQEMIRQLQPYEGKTVVVVGHVSERHGTFVVHLPNGEVRPIPIAEWLAAAEESNVNLITIGCNSEKIGTIGARGLINSRQVRHALRRVIEREPKTMGEFLQGLTSDDLQIVIDPISAKLFESGIVLRNAISGRDVARIGLQGSRMIRTDQSSTENSLITAQYSEKNDACFSQMTGERFDSCIASVRQIQHADLLAIATKCRDQNLAVLPILLKRAEALVSESKVDRLVYGSLYGMSVLLLGWLMLVSTEARRDQEDHGNRLSNVFGRWRVREMTARFTGRGTALGLRHPLSDIVWAGVLVALASGAYFMTDFTWYVALLYALVLLVAIGFLIEAGEKTIVGSSLLDAITCAALVLTLSSVYAFGNAAFHHNEVVANRDGLSETYETTQRPPTAEDDCWPLSMDSNNALVPVLVTQPVVSAPEPTDPTDTR